VKSNRKWQTFVRYANRGHPVWIRSLHWFCFSVQANELGRAANDSAIRYIPFTGKENTSLQISDFFTVKSRMIHLRHTHSEIPRPCSEIRKHLSACCMVDYTSVMYTPSNDSITISMCWQLMLHRFSSEIRRQLQAVLAASLRTADVDMELKIVHKTTLTNTVSHAGGSRESLPKANRK
jgi:hypothetical protein